MRGWPRRGRRFPGKRPDDNPLAQLFRKLAQRTFPQDGYPGFQYFAGGIVYLWPAFLVEALIPQLYALDRILLDHQFSGGKTGIDFNPQAPGNISQPADHLADRKDIIPGMAQVRWHDKPR